MKRSRPTDLGVSITRFFEEYLPGQRGMSVHTIRSYRDAVVLMLVMSGLNWYSGRRCCSASARRCPLQGWEESPDTPIRKSGGR